MNGGQLYSNTATDAAGGGGGLYNLGTAILTGVLISNNNALGTGGGIYAGLNTGSTAVNACDFQGNSAGNGANAANLRNSFYWYSSPDTIYGPNQDVAPPA